MTADQIGQMVEDWFTRSVACGAIARNSETYNQAFKAKDELKAQLIGSLAPQKEDTGNGGTT